MGREEEEEEEEEEVEEDGVEEGGVEDVNEGGAGYAELSEETLERRSSDSSLSVEDAALQSV